MIGRSWTITRPRYQRQGDPQAPRRPADDTRQNAQELPEQARPLALALSIKLLAFAFPWKVASLIVVGDAIPCLGQRGNHAPT
jgi:hypothetical protein